MKTHRIISGSLIILIFCMGLLLLFAPAAGDSLAAPEAAPEKRVQQAWNLASDLGAYQFDTTIEQITYPAPAIANVGRSSQTQAYFLQGAVDREAESLSIMLWQGSGNLATGQDGFEMHIQDGKAFGRTIGGVWQEIDDFSGLFAPGSDPLAYLAGAKNLQPLNLSHLPADVSPFSFEIDGPTFASYLRTQLENQLRRTGELPHGLNLDTPRGYREMTGDGQIWLDSDGLPLRLRMDLEFPDTQTGERVTAHIQTDFSGFERQTARTVAFWDSPLNWAAVNLNLPNSLQDWRARLPLMGFWLLLAALLTLFIIYRHSKRAYAAFVGAVIVSMVLTPLLQSQQVSAYYERQNTTAAEAEFQSQNRAAIQQSQETLLASDWDPHQALLDAPHPEPLSVNSDLSSVSNNDPEDSTDSDLDGLTDHLEISLGTDPALADSDGDHLDDGVEFLRLGTAPLNADSDGDGIRDNVEVAGFQHNAQDWYLDPNAADSNGDGRIDMLECPDLVGRDRANGHTCLDQDEDGIPDAFDRDDDGDGLADRIDLYPDGLVDRDGKQFNGQNLDYFNGEQPFKFKVQSLQSDLPVFVDFQLIPENPDHLTYALNVLDWPSTDTDGQVQHVKNTTFASSMSKAQQQANPSAAYGDLRLIPMLEIVMTGSQIPLPLAAPTIDISLDDEILGSLHLEQNSADRDKTDFIFSFDDPGANYTVNLYPGSCPVSGAPLTASNNVSHGDTLIYNHHIIDLADGQHAITISDGAEGDCTSLGNIVNGPYRNKMVNPELLQPYGISVREINKDRKLAAYVPLNLVPDETGSGRVAFSGRMAYQLSASASWQKEQEVRLIWLVQMLTDNCDTSGFVTIVGEDESAANDRMRTWCATPDNRTPDGIQVVQTYDDAWVLTGMSVREDHGLDSAIIYEDPTNGDPTNSENLWQAARSLSAVFLAGRDENGDDRRDVSIYINDQDGNRIGNSNIFNRLDENGNVPDGDERRWGIEQGALQVARERYPHQDYSAYQAMEDTPEILDNFPHDAIPTLLFAREEHFRSADLQAISKNGQVFSIDLGTTSHPKETIMGLRWMPYRYNVGTDPDGQIIGWEPYPAGEYWDQLEIQYQDIFTQIDPTLDEETHLGQAIVARAYYVSLMQGLVQQDRFGSDLLWTPDPAGDSDAALIAGLAIGFGKKIESIVYAISTDFIQEYGSWGEFLQVGIDRNNNVYTAIYEEIHGFWYSIGKSIKANTVGPWVKLFSGGYKSKIGAGIALAGGIAVIGLTLFAVSQESNGFAAAEIVLAGLSVVMAIQGVVSATVKVISTVNKYGSFTAAMRGDAASISANAKGSISKAAVIGLIIGVVITWGTVITMLCLQAGLGGGISGTAIANAIAGAIASTVVAIIMFAIAAIPVVGWIIAAVVGIIDALVNMLCTIFVPDAQEDHPAVSWFCGGLTGIVTQALTVLIYSGNQMVNLYPEDYDRLEFSNFEADDLVHPDWGIRQGNSIRYGVSLTNTIDIAPLPDNLGAGYRYQYSDNTLRTSTFDYQLSYTNTTEIHEDLDRKTMRDDWVYQDGDGPEWGDFGHTWHAPVPVYIEQSVQSTGIELSQAGINMPSSLYLTEGYALPSQNCILGVCTIWTERSSEHYDLGSAILLDVFPATLTDFYQLAAKNDGYALAWAQTGSDTFPRLQDADGDSIPYYADQHDNNWDNDGDTLSDQDEVRLGTNPDDPDSDNDGLGDELELLASTNPLRPDSDGDGLLDSEEVYHQDVFDQDGDGNTAEWLGGWYFVYDLAADGTPLETRVIPSPLSGDSDGDSLTDYQEKNYGMNPLRISNPNLLTFESSLLEANGGSYVTSDGFVQPGDSLYYEAALKNELYNRWAHGLLGTDFPAGFSNADISPENFLLYPQEQQTLNGQVPVAGDTAPGVYHLTQTAGALISDWRELSQAAVLWFPFEDDTQAVTFADRSGSIPAQDGVCTNPVAGLGCVPVKNDGAFGGSLQLDGSAYVTSDYDPSDTDFAVSFWFKTNQADGGMFAVNGTLGLDRRIYLHNGQVRVQLIRASNIQTLSSAETYNDGQWHHLVHTFGPAVGGQRLYLDGMLVDSKNLSRTNAAVNNLYIGHTTNSQNNFNGQIDDLRIYDKSLGHAEIEVLFNMPVLDLRFNSDAGWRDSSPFKNNASCESGNCPSRGNGIDGKAADFNGLTYLTVGPDDSLDLSEGTFTMGAWVYPDNTPRYCHEREWNNPDCATEMPQPQGILGFGTGGSNAYPSLQRVGQQLRFTFGDNDYFTTGDVLRPHHWNHVAVTFDGTAIKIYVDGTLVAQDATIFNGQVPPNNATLTVGRSGNRAILKAKKIRVADVYEGENTGEICLAFKPTTGSTWFSLFDQDIQEGLVDGNYLPILIDINTQRGFNNGGTLLLWENDTNPRCVTDDNKYDDSPINGYDDLLYIDSFTTYEVSEGFDGPTNENFAVFEYDGAAQGFVYYVYENDSIPFHGRIDEVQIYNRPLDEIGIAEMYQAHRKALHLQLDDAPGTTSFVDASFDSQQATCSGENCPIAGVPGRVNQAAIFDGNDALSLGQSEINRLSEEVTLAAWVRPEHLNGVQWIAATARTYSANGYGLALDGDGLRFQTFGVHTYEFPTAGLPAGEWTHIAAVLDADNNVDFYINGSWAATVPGSAPVTPDTDDIFLIGAGTATGSANRQQFFSGEIDDLQIFSNALGENGIQQLYSRAPFVQLHLDEGIPTPNSTWYDFEDAANPNYSAHCQGTTCPEFGFGIDGQLGTAVEFDGVDDTLTYGYRTGLNQNTFSLSAWVMPTQVKDSWQTIISRGYPDAAYGLFIQPDSMTPAFIVGDGSCTQQILPAANPLIQNTWNHLTAVKQGNEMKLYLNGQIQGSLSANIGYCNQAAPISIGGGFSHPDSRAFSGRIDEVNFYTHALPWNEIAEIYSYQSKWVEERQNHAITVDDDAPTVELTTTGDHLPLTSIQMLITASDPTSGVDRVEFGVRQPGATTYRWETAPPCQDSLGATAWCPTFDPTIGGEYSLRARVTDKVGHISRASASVSVENAAPTGSFDFAAHALLTPILDTGRPNTWQLTLSGTVSDPSGINADTLTVSLLDQDDLLVPLGAQRANLVGNTWDIEYKINAPNPSGIYTVQLNAQDAIAARAGLDQNQQDIHTLVLEQNIQIDANPPAPFLDLEGLPLMLAKTQTITGSVTENPVPIELSLRTDAAADELGLRLTCDGQLRYQIESDQLPARSDDFTWQGDAHRNAACTLTLTDSSSNGGTSGAISICGDEITVWDGNFTDEHTINFSADASACGPLLDVSGIASVETALISKLPGSSAYNPEPLADKLLHLPLDESPAATERLYFRDLSTLGFSGICGGACPSAAQFGHIGNAVFFDGLDDEIIIAQDQDLGNRDQLTLALWLQPKGDSSGVLLYKENEFSLLRNPIDGQIYYQLGNTAPGWGNWVPSGYIAPRNQWTHFVLTYDGSQVRIFVDGQASTTSIGNGSIPNQSDLLLGSDVDGYRFRGLLDDFQVYARALNDSEIHALYLGADPVLHLPLEESWASDSMRLMDASGWDHPVRLQTATQTNSTVPGQVGAYALDFDGIDDYALVTDSPALDLEQFSIGLWINADHWIQNATFHPILVKGSADNAQVNYGFYLDQQNGNLNLRIDDAACTSTTYFVFSQYLIPGTWNHIAATYDGAEVVLYLNQQEVRRVAYTGGTCLNDQPLRLAQGLGGSIPAPIYSGLLDDVIVYPRALSSGEVASLFARGWQPAETSSTGPGTALSDWHTQIPNGLEGVYRLDLRAWDEGGNVSTRHNAAWQGEVDTRNPRLTLEAELMGENVRYTTTANDFNLAAGGLVTPCGADFTSQSGYFQADWYRALVPMSQRLVDLTAACERPSSELPGEVGATDTPGLARSVVVSDTVAYLADSQGGLQIIDFSNPIWPQNMASLTAGYANDLAVASGGPVLTPDLTVTHLETYPADPELGSGFTISVTVQNQGIGRVYGFDLALYQDAQPAPCQASIPQWTAAIPQLDVGQSAVAVFSHPGLSNLTPHDFYAQADSGCAILEVDEDNNIFGPAVITAVQPDLIVESMVLEPASIYENQPITATVTIRNQGTGTAHNFRTSIFSDTGSITCGDPGWGAADVTELAPGEVQNLTFVHPGFSPPDAHYFLSVVDSGCTVTESDELNNTRGENFTVLPPGTPDLVVTDIQSSNTSPLIGESFIVTATVHNQGDGAATGFDIAVYEDYEPLTCADPNWWDFSRVTGGLAAGATTQITFTHSGFSTLGLHTIYAQADSSCEITEPGENNNSFPLYINVTDANPPDLVIDSFEVPTSVAVGETYVVTATVTNQGLGTAIGPFNMISLAAFVNRAPFGCDEVADGGGDYMGAIAPSETVIITTTMPGPDFGGIHHLYAFIDSSCAISEPDENNNIFGPSAMDVTGSPPMADLVIQSATASPSPIAQGEPFSITVVVNNIGSLGVGAFEVGIYTDTMPSSTCSTTPWSTQAVTSLDSAARESVTFNYPGVDTPGNFSFYALADSTCQQSEFNDDNNTDSILVWVNTGLTSESLLLDRGELIQKQPAALEGNPAIAAGPQVILLSNSISSPETPTAAPIYVYLAETNGLRVFNVDDPANPYEIAALTLPGTPRGIAVDAEIAYLITQSEGLHAVDISNPGYPGLLDTLALPGYGQSVAVAGNHAFVAVGIDGLLVVDITDLANLQLVGSYNTPGYAYDVAVSGNYAYLADANEGLRVIDIINPTNPLPVGALRTYAQSSGITLDGSHAYLADGTGGLKVIDISDPTAPVLLHSYDTPGSAEDVAFSASLALVADSNAGLRIINASGVLPQSTACDLAGNCATSTMTQSFAALAEAALMANPQVEINYPMTAGPLVVAITNLPPVLDSNEAITITGYATTTLTTLDAITVTVDGTPLAVQNWNSGTVESDWSAAWTPAADGPYRFEAAVSDADGTTTSTALTVTTDTLMPSVLISPTLYTGQDYHEPRSINLRGEARDAGGVTKVEVLGLDGIWREAHLSGEHWHASWQLDDETLPDNRGYLVEVRATDIAGHTFTASDSILVDVLPPAPVDLTISSGGIPLQPGDILPLTTANLTLDWTPSSDGGGLAADYQVTWSTQITETASQTEQVIPTGDPLTTNLTAYDGQKVSVLWGVEDSLGNQRWQDFGSVVVDSPLTPDYIIFDNAYRGWMDSGCTDLGVERRAERGSYSEKQILYATWDAQALRLSWLGADWDADGDLFVYLDTAAGGSSVAYNPFGDSPQITLSDGLLADTILWVQDRSQAVLLRWDGSGWVLHDGLSEYGYQWGLLPRTQTPVTDLYLTFEQLGMAAGDSLDMLAFAAEEGSMNLWAAHPQGNLLNSPRVTNYLPAAGQNADFNLTQRYHWDAITDGVCPNGSGQPRASGAFPDTDLQVRWEASPEGVSYSLINDGLYWLQDELLNNPPADLSTQMDFLVVDQPALPNTQMVTYTLQVHNRGMDTAYGVQAEITADFALVLLDGDPAAQTILVGDLAPGASETITLRGQIDTSISSLSWARAAVRLYDASHPNSGAALEYLWLDQRVDQEGPKFLGLQQPIYLLGPGENWLRGYAYDQAGVTAMSVQADGPQGVEMLSCPVDAPFSGRWDCLWDVSGQNGALFNLSLQATDGYGQPSEWNSPQTYLLDTQAPTVTLDVSATQVISGSLVRDLNFSLGGEITDNGGLGEVEICLEGDCQPAALSPDAGNSTRVVDDIPGTAIPIHNGTTCNGSEIVRTYEITQSLRVGEVQLGVSTLHDRRDELHVVLTSPNGITATLLTDEDRSGAGYQNADFWLQDAASISFADLPGDHTSVMPFYTFDVRPEQPLQPMVGTPAQGTWTLSICDLNPGSNDGAYLRSQLVITPHDPYIKSGRWSAQIQNAASLDYVAQTLSVFGQDVVGNRTMQPLDFSVIVDNVSPVITVTHSLTDGYLGQSGRILEGTISEGGPSAVLWVHVLQPNGEIFRYPAARQGDSWYFKMDYELLGDYQFWLTATDLAGNTSVAGVYPFSVLEEPTLYLPLIFNRYDSNIVYELGDTPGSEWSSQDVETAPNGEIFLGPFDNDDLTLNLDDLPPHSEITISFDLYIIRSWDGNQLEWGTAANQLYPMAPNEIVGPDIWSFQAGGQTLLTTTFSNWPNLGFNQAFPGSYPGGDYPAQSSAVAVNTLGYTFGGLEMDATYHLTFTFDHSESTLTSGFSASSLQIGEDESWGIDNVAVTIAP